MNEKVIVLMSTYNGQLYLKEQIDSIFNQTYKGKIKLIIRDDGSIDATKKIVESITTNELREIEFIEGKNIGPQKSFLNLIEISEYAKAYFFADQDDVWDKNKIEVAVKAIGEENVPICYCSNYRLSDMELKVYKEEAIEKVPYFSPLKILFYNQIPGCTIGFNYLLMTLLKKIKIDNVMMHDSYVLSFAAFCGKIIFDKNSRITHRIHMNNVVGEGHKKIKPFKWIKEKFKLLIHKEDYDVSKMAEQYLIVTKDCDHLQYVEDIMLLKDFKKKLKFTRLLLKHPDSKDKKFDRTTISIRSKILFHLF